MTNRYRLKGKSRDSYMELVLAFPLASIRSDKHLAEAQRVIDGLLARDALDEGDVIDLDALSDLVGAYEDEHHAIEPASDADMLRHLMDAKGVSQMQLSRDTYVRAMVVHDLRAGDCTVPIAREYGAALHGAPTASSLARRGTLR